jgi:hypothetical protein
MRVPDTIAIELEAAGDSRSTFRLRVDSTVVGGNLTAAQAQLLVGDILERIALPNRDRIGRARSRRGSPRVLAVIRATGITVYLLNGGLLEYAQQMAAHDQAL